VDNIFVRQTCCVWTTSLTAFRWGSHEDSKQRRKQFSIKSVQWLFKIPVDFPTQCIDAYLAFHCEKTSRTSTARFRTMHQRHWSCHWEAGQLCRQIISRQNFRTHKRPLSVTWCLLPAATLVSDNSDDKPRHLPLYVNNLGSCLSYDPRGIASVTGYC